MVGLRRMAGAVWWASTVMWRIVRGERHEGGMLRREDDVPQSAALVDDLLHDMAGRHLDGHRDRRRRVRRHHRYRHWSVVASMHGAHVGRPAELRWHAIVWRAAIAAAARRLRAGRVILPMVRVQMVVVVMMGHVVGRRVHRVHVIVDGLAGDHAAAAAAS